MTAAAQKSEWTKFPSPESVEENFIPLIVELPRPEPRPSDSYHKFFTTYLKRERDRSIFTDKRWQKSHFIKSVNGTLAKAPPNKAKQEMTEIDAKIAASEARTDTKFAEMMGELRLINSRMEHVEKSVNEVKSFVSGLKQTIITTAIVTAIGVIGVVVAIFGYGTSMFATGMDAQTIADKATQSAIQSLRPDIMELQKSRERQEQQYDLILKAIQAQTSNKP